MEHPTTQMSLTSPSDLPAPAPVLGFLLVHAALRREMGALVTAADHGATDLGRRLELFDCVIRAHHHGEDQVLLPVLRSRDSAIREAADEVEDDHARLDSALDRLRAATGGDDPAIVRRGVHDLATFLDDHLALEETRLLPVWLATLSAAEQPSASCRLRCASRTGSACNAASNDGGGSATSVRRSPGRRSQRDPLRRTSAPGRPPSLSRHPTAEGSDGACSRNRWCD